MTRTRLIPVLSSILIFSVFVAPGAYGQLTRTAVSISGTDLNTCSVPSPCRTFGRALSQTNPEGEIIALDSGGYGPFTIDKSVTVRAVPGAYAAIAPLSGDGITISAGLLDVIFLRGLSLKGAGALHGIRFLSGASLHVRNVDISAFNVSGIHFVAPATLIVSDSTFIGNGAGIFISTSSGIASMSLERVAFENNDLYGLEMRSNTKGSIRDSVALGGDNGLVAGPTTGTADLDVERCLVSLATAGLKSGGDGGTATVRVSNSTIVGNEFGIVKTDPSVIRSRGNNTVEGNVSDGTFNSTFAPK